MLQINNNIDQLRIRAIPDSLKVLAPLSNFFVHFRNEDGFAEPKLIEACYFKYRSNSGLFSARRISARYSISYRNLELVWSISVTDKPFSRSTSREALDKLEEEATKNIRTLTLKTPNKGTPESGDQVINELESLKFDYP